MSVIKGIKVGSTDITGAYPDSSISDTKTITVVNEGLSAIDKPDDSTYTGLEQRPSVKVYAVVNGETETLELGTDYTLEYTNNTDASTSTVKATVTATGINNYSGTVSETWTIAPADMTVTKSDQTYVYTGKKQGSGISVSTIGEQIPTVKYHYEKDGTSDDTPASYEMEDIPTIANVSDSGMIYYQVTAPNHNTVTGYYTLTITPKSATLEWGTLVWRYNGEAHSTTCEVSNLIGSDTCTVTLSNNSITNIGTTIVTATGLSNSNYELPSSGLTHTLTVTSGLFVKVSGTWTPVKKVYKKIEGTWVLQELSGSFNTDKLYMKR